MNCQSLRNWLLQAESLQPKAWPPEVTKHLKGCAQCVKYVNSLSKLERSWREQPLPASCTQAKSKFLTKLAQQAKAVPVKPAPLRWRPVRWAAAAAAVLVVSLGLLAWLVFSPSETRASEVVDRLVDLNTDLSKADYSKRKQILDANEENLRKNLQLARLSKEERASGEQLLDAARKLAVSDDLEEDEEIVTDVAEKLFDRANSAQAKGSDKESEHCNRRYAQFMEKAVSPLNSKLRVIDRLIELNMEMASADTKKRKQLFKDNEESLRQDITNAGLSPDDQAMAEKLLEVSRRMAANVDLSLQAQAITEAADDLRLRVETAANKGKETGPGRSARYHDFVEKALHPFFDKLKASQPKGPPDAKKGGFDFTKFQKQIEMNRLRAQQHYSPEMRHRFEAQKTKKGPGWPPFKSGKR
jgi:hypothetical protein